MLKKLTQLTERLTQIFALVGGVIILVQMTWITYGVIKRYFFSSPDGVVTEATALLLFPVAFLGLAYTLRENAYPTVTFIVEGVKGSARRWLLSLNYLMMFVVGFFFSYAAVNAAFKSFESGSASEILLWPRYLFWIPSAMALVLFTCYVFLRMLTLWQGHVSSDHTKDSRS